MMFGNTPEEVAAWAAEAFGVGPDQVIILQDEVQELMAGQLDRAISKVMEEARDLGRKRRLFREPPPRNDFGVREYRLELPHAASRDVPFCQAERSGGTCGCSFVKRYRLGCKNEHVSEEWLCTCCAKATGKTCAHPAADPGTGTPRTCGEALTAVPVEDLGPSSGAVPASVQRTRGRATGPGDGENWFRGLGE